MSDFAATQIPKPADEQAFERLSVRLWRALLNDPNVLRNGRRGQGQNGVDLYGIRDGNAAHLVGVQCKLKGHGRQLTESEVRNEVDLALKFLPPLREYFIVTTAADDAKLQELARNLSVEQAASGRTITIHVWGWNTLEERISEHPDVRDHFDPSFTPYMHAVRDDLLAIKADVGKVVAAGSQILAIVSPGPTIATVGDATKAIANAVDAAIDAQIDMLRDLIPDGKPATARPLLEKLLTQVEATASGRIRFRLKANIGACLLALGDDAAAASLIAEAYAHAPDEPKAVANRMLAFMLDGQWESAVEFGREKLRVDPSNEDLAGYLVQAARFDPGIDDPLPLVPEALRETPFVLIGYVEFLRGRDRRPEWWHVARGAALANPENKRFAGFVAEANLEEVLSSRSYERLRLLNADEKQRVEAAVNCLHASWDRILGSEGALRPEGAAICANLSAALMALGRTDEAATVARQGLNLDPKNSDIGLRAMAIALEIGDDALAARAFPVLPDDPIGTMFGFRYYAICGNWEGLLGLYQRRGALVPVAESHMVSAIARFAEFKCDPQSIDEDRVRVVLEEVAGDARASIVVADLAKEAGYPSIADRAYRNAVNCIGPDSHIADRLTVGRHALEIKDWSVVCDVLYGRIATDRDSDLLRSLTYAMANDTPVRRRAVTFFEKLPVYIAETPLYAHALGTMHFNRGDLDSAENAFRQAFATSNALTDLLALLNTLRRADKLDDVNKILVSLDPTIFQGTPRQQMHLAQELRAIGRAEVALAFGYKVLRDARNDPDIALRFFGLVMMRPDERPIPSVNIVAKDCWVRLVSDRDEVNEFVIEDGPDRPADGRVSPAHPMAAKAIGLAVGQSFTITPSHGAPTVWNVAAIKHRYLYALHDVMQNFQTRFPDAGGIWNVQIEHDDITPVLEQVRQRAESNRKLADVYLVQNLPLAFIASSTNNEVIGFAEYIRSLGGDIKVCVGLASEQSDAMASVDEGRKTGAVLDTYAAWTVATMDALDILAATLGPLAVPRSVIDDLISLRDRDAIPTGQSMTVAWIDGKYVRQEHTAESIEARKALISKQIAKIQAHCAIEAVVAPDVPTDLAINILRDYGAYVLDAPVLAAMSGRLLVTEDMHYRHIAAESCGARGLWLQIAFRRAHLDGLISLERYSDLAVGLAYRQHGYLLLDAATLSAALNADEHGAGVAALARYIGTQNADMVSHLSVVRGFLASVWPSNGKWTLGRAAATGAVLEALLRFRQSDWATVLAMLLRDQSDDLRSYVSGWMIGHFLDSTEVRPPNRRSGHAATKPPP